jgi:energy-coupling factor transporter ATP-binding protein EcfA2
MNVSTFTKKTKHEIVGFLILIASLLIYSRKPALMAVALIPIALAALLIMRTSILRKFAHTPIRQVAFADLLEPIIEYRQSASGKSRPEIVRYGKREIPLVKRIEHCYVNFEEYIARKGNPSVMVCGRSGMGKSELMNVLLLAAKEPKVVFSFKPNDAYLRMPCQVIDVSRHIPDPFQDADAFSIAYALAFPANVRGITFSQVRAIVKSVARESKNWNEFKDNLKRTERKATDIQKEALALIEAQIGGLVIGEGSFSIDLTKDTVLDFSYLDESAKTFYAEIALRQIWSSLTSRFSIQEKQRKVLIVIDEVHRLTQLYEMEARTIVDTLMRQVRQFGALYTATQNYSDIPDALRNQFATQLTFNTTSERDLEAIRKIDSAYVWIVKELRPHQFIDLTFRVGNGGIIPIFKADRIALPERQVRYDAPANVAPVQPKSADTTDYESEILNILRKTPLHQTGIDSALGIEREDSRRLVVKKELKKLLDGDEIGRIRYLNSMGKEKVLYYLKDPNLSPIHDYMQKEAVSILTSNNVKADRVNVTGNGSVPDIETSGFDVEIETGLKHSGADLQERLSQSTKKVIILTPNYEEAGRYSRYASERVKIATMPELKEAISAGATSRSQEQPPSHAPLKEGGEPTRRVGEGT